MFGKSTSSTADPSTTQTDPIQTSNGDLSFQQVYDNAKLNNDRYRVSKTLKNHPDWLTKIPDGRRWTTLHQIVFSGDVAHLKEILAHQIANPNFRLLCKTLDDKTVREVASERAHIHPHMIRYIERLVAGDQLLNNAKDGKWELIRQVIRQQPDLVNEKPPYRRHYLAHHLASVGQLDIFKNLSEICHFKLDVLANNLTISQVAREHNHLAFAEYVENLHTDSTETSTTTAACSSVTSHQTTGQPQYSPGFHDDLSISIIPANINFSTLPLTSSNSNPAANYHHLQHFATHSIYQGDNPSSHAAAVPVQSKNNPTNSGAAQAMSHVPSMTDAEQIAYEKKITGNVTNISEQHLLNSITCCITKAILRDPVVAADGFTYEREAITEWFQHSTRSPMTNEELESVELKPNYAIKSILKSLQESTGQSKMPTGKGGQTK